MQKNVSAPVVVIAFVLLAGVLYGVFQLTYAHRKHDYSAARAQLPPDIPGQDKPLPPPPGMHMPGTIMPAAHAANKPGRQE